MAELLIGCGNKRDKLIVPPGRPNVWTELTTLDNDPNCGADIEWDLERFPLPFAADSFDEIHAYHVLEHQGRQGDFRFFFDQFSEFWRILKPAGICLGIVPEPGSGWVFGDPGHTRFLPPEVFTFLDQTEYEKQVGVTGMADYRRFYRADFHPEYMQVRDSMGMCFALKAVKPSRIAA